MSSRVGAAVGPTEDNDEVDGVLERPRGTSDVVSGTSTLGGGEVEGCIDTVGEELGKSEKEGSVEIFGTELGGVESCTDNGQADGIPALVRNALGCIDSDGSPEGTVLGNRDGMAEAVSFKGFNGFVFVSLFSVKSEGTMVGKIKGDKDGSSLVLGASDDVVFASVEGNVLGTMDGNVLGN